MTPQTEPHLGKCAIHLRRVGEVDAPAAVTTVNGTAVCAHCCAEAPGSALPYPVLE